MQKRETNYKKDINLSEQNNSKQNILKNIADFNKMPKCCDSLSELKSTAAHTVLVNCNIKVEQPPDPYPTLYEDKWNNEYVHLPCSPQNIIKTRKKNSKENEINIWNIIIESFSQPIKSLDELKNAISKYISKSKFNLNCLHYLLEKKFTKEENEEFIKIILPGMIKLALQLPEICTQAIPVLKKYEGHAITISQKQIACLLANAFLCTFPKQPKNKCPEINFFDLLSTKNIENTKIIDLKVEKLKCILNYFRRILLKEPIGTITFQRKYLQTPPKWPFSEMKLKDLYVTDQGTIEKDGASMLQVDFADPYIGGLIIQHGCAQEELLFSISPELIISRLFTSKLEDEETLLMTGYEQYNKYSGYGYTFCWMGDFIDELPRDKWGRRYSQMIAMDALRLSGSSIQYKQSMISRDLNKAYCGFDEPEITSENLPAIASGKWGCGVFKGDPILKSLIQLMAASEAERDLVLFTFHDSKLANELSFLYNILMENNIIVGSLWNLLEKYYTDVIESSIEFKFSLFDFLCKEFNVSSICKISK